MNIDDPYFPISCHLSSSLNAADVDLVSAKDYLSSYYDGPDYPVPGGFGNLVEAWSSDIKVMLNTKVSRIKWGAPLVELKTSQGTLFAKKIIITVSTGILANNDIEMVPQLPAEKQNAISNLPMGTLNKIGISFKKQLFSEQERGWYITWPGKKYITDQEVGSFEVSSSGLQNVVVFSGGRFGEWLEERGPKVMQDYAISKIESVLGSQCSKNIESVITTAWASEPLTKGAYSYATPNNSLARAELAKNIEKKLFFAGEATIPKHFGTAHGAYFSGINASKEIITCS
jgi:monoamine oxidase